MNDDFNTAKAVADLSDVFKRINELCETSDLDSKGHATLRAIRSALDSVGASLGLFHEPPSQVLERIETRLRQNAGDIDDAAIDRLVQERNEARSAKDFSRADAIRDQLADMGIVIKDSPDGTTWELTRS